MQVTFLGTSAGAPTKQRNVSGVALRNGSTWDLFDCGEATQHQLLHTPLSLARLRRVFISHLHGDHCFGLFGLLGSRSMSGSNTALTIIGPPGLRAMVELVLETSDTHLTYPIEFVEVTETGGRVVETAELTVDALPLTHRVMSFAWLMQEGERAGRLNPDAARAAGVPDGPLFGKLARGETVQLDDGRTVKPDDIVGDARPGRRVIIAGDNSAPRELLERTGPVHLLVHEATFTEPVLETLGDDWGHSTAARVAIAAEQAGVNNLVLTHFSPRYLSVRPRTDGGSGSSVMTIGDVENEAREHFSRSLHLANDFDMVELGVDGTSVEITARDAVLS